MNIKLKRWKLGAIIGLLFAVVLSIPAFFYIYIGQYVYYFGKFSDLLLILITLPAAITTLFLEESPFLFIIPMIVQYSLFGAIIGKVIDSKEKRIFWIVMLVFFIIILILASLLSFLVLIGPGS